MKTVKIILKWYFGISFIIGGISLLVNKEAVGIVSILIGLFIIPPIMKVIEEKIKYTFPTPIKFTVVVGGMILIGTVISVGNKNKDKEVDKIIQRASQKIDEGEIDSAFIFIEQAKKQYSTSDHNKAIDLEKEIKKSRSEDYAKEVLASMTDEEFIQLQNGKLTKSYINQKTLNINFYVLLNELSYQRKLMKQAELEKNRREKVEEQFSAWDGSHPTLSRMIKDNCRNPKSYEHIETKFRDDGSSIFVITRYRAENGFGGMSIGTVSARVDFDGNVIEIISQD